MDEFIRSGRFADVILVALAIELVIVGFYLWRRGEGLALLSFVASCLAGGSLVLAMRAILNESGWLFVAIYLAAALLAHVADLALRLLIARQAAGVPSREP
ncbi:MAG: hypothetical protein IOC86_01040 [Aestuariivirga sp.]|nr:hypothetical protein [Aestuariivirga sp.]